MIKVFDSSAFLNRFFFNDIDNVITTNSVLDEIRNKEQKMQVENLIQKGKIKIQDPSFEILKMIKSKAPKMLSKTDVEVIALAYELKAELHTDDFMMRKLAKDLHIKVEGIAYEVKTSVKKVSNENFLDDIYERVKPTKEELNDVKQLANEIITKLETIAKKEKYPIKKIILAGSSARGTFMHNKKDLDIFILFDLRVSIDEIKNYNIKLLKKAYPKTKFVEEYGEHPYLQAEISNHSIEFVPGFYITKIEQRKSSVDRTPLHLAYLNKHQDVETKKQVILLKLFLKNNLLYGADQENNGFSGYLTELFILKFGTFENVLKAISNLNENKYLNIEPIKVKKKFDDYFVFVDPTDANRNVASAVTKKNWVIFSKLAKEYLLKPNKKYFLGDIYANELPKNIFCFQVDIKGKTPDSNWGIIKSLAKRLSNELNSKHYKVENHSGIIFEGKGYVLLNTEFKDILNGPLINDAKNVKAFKKKHKKTFEDKGKLYSEFKFTKDQFLKEAKKLIKKLCDNKTKEIKFKDLKVDLETLKRVKKDFL